jgi:MFS family permease
MPTAQLPLLLPLLLTLSVQGLIACGMVALPVLLPAYAAELGVQATFAGLITATVYGGATLTALLVSARVRWLGAVRTCQAALLAAGVGLCLAAGGSAPTMVTGALALGLGYGPVTAASALLLTRAAAPRAYGLVFSINRVSIPFGAALAGAMLPTVSALMGWRSALATLGLLCFGCAWLLQAVRHLDSADRAVAGAPQRLRVLVPLRDLLRHPKRRVLTQASLAFLAAQSCLAAFTVAFLVEELSYTYVQAGVVLAAAQIAGVVARLVMGFVSDRLRRRTVVIALMGLSIAAANALAAAAGPSWHANAVLAVFLLYGAGALGWNGVLLAELVHTASPDQSGEIAGASAAIAFAGAVAGPVLFSTLLGWTGYGAAFGLLALATLACSVALLRFERRSRKPATARACIDTSRS